MVSERQCETPCAMRTLGRMAGMLLLGWSGLAPAQAPKVSGRTILVVESYHAEDQMGS